MSKRDRKITIIGAIILIIGTAGIKYYRDHRTVINGIAVPPMPNSRENNATLLGVDVDQNGIRDDIDRMIAEAFGNKPKAHHDVLAYFRALSVALEDPTEKNTQTTWERVSCVSGKGFEDVPIIERQFLNTSLRGGALAHALAGTTSHGICVPE